MSFDRHKIFGKAELDVLLVQVDAPFLVGYFLLQVFDETQDVEVGSEGDALDRLLERPELALTHIVIEVELIIQKVLNQLGLDFDFVLHLAIILRLFDGEDF